MANSKISALTAATTPLAGTEVLPIVQSSTTKQVSIANVTAGRAVSADSLTLTGSPLPATSGGTGQSSYAVGDLIYANTTTTLAKLADVATGNALISGGVSTAPSWGKIGLTTHVSGTLPTANGGTNLTSFTSGGVVYASSSSALATGSALTFDGTKFTQTVSTTAAAGLAEFKNTATNAQTANIIATNDSGTAVSIRVFGSAAGSFGTLTANSPMIYTAASELNLVANNASGVIKFGVGATPNLMASIDANGNYIPAVAAKGINFTANTPAAGMTSQLLNWYEEGTWTPNQGAGLTVVGAFSSTGRYTRIGRQVSISGTVTGATSVAVVAAGVITSNLPFTVVTAGHGGATNAANNAFSIVICTSTNVTSAGAIAATGTITFSATYFV